VSELDETNFWIDALGVPSHNEPLYSRGNIVEQATLLTWDLRTAWLPKENDMKRTRLFNSLLAGKLWPGTASGLVTETVSHRKPDGLILSTGNLYFTSHEGSTASVWRTAQSASPGQEFLLYSEPNARFGDITFAQVDGVWWGYFFAEPVTTSLPITIKRVPLTGGEATVLAELDNVDVTNNRRNLLTDGVNLYWQDVEKVRKMPIRGGAITVLDEARPNTPTAGIAFQNTNIIYASVEAIRFVPAAGASTSPLVRTIAQAASRVVTLNATSTGIVWGENDGPVRKKIGSTVITISNLDGLALSIWGQKFWLFTALAWTFHDSNSERLFFQFLWQKWSMPIGDDSLGVTITPTRKIFWGDANGVHWMAF
jgi:hypothetical protein